MKASVNSSLSLLPLRNFITEVLARAFLELFPEALLVKGGVTEFGFYYDFISHQPVDVHVIAMLEERMRGMIKGGDEVKVLEMMRENAANFFEHKNQEVVASLVRSSRQNIVSIFQYGKFHDYCACVELVEIEDVGAFKLFESESLSYYLEEEGEIDVKRISGTAFFNKSDLKKFVKSFNAGKKQNHLHYIKEKNLLELNQNISSLGFCWNHKGLEFRDELLDLWRKDYLTHGFNIVSTPTLVKKTLVDRLGSLDEGMLPVCLIQDVEYVVPDSFIFSHAALFSSRVRKEEDLPLRYAESGQLAISSKSAGLWGVFNAQLVFVDQAHVFCSFEKIEKEIIYSLQFIDKFIKMFNFEGNWCLRGSGLKTRSKTSVYKVKNSSFKEPLSTKGDKPGVEVFDSVGMIAYIEVVKRAFGFCGIHLNDQLEANENGTQVTSFSELMIEMDLRDRYGREWKGPYININFTVAERFGLEYQTSDGKIKRPVVLTQSVFRSLERFVGLLLEHNEGNLRIK